ncbi:MAG TPA: PilZ domain-containing protein [Tepidisphaeraceae bacterium]|nr:PilZ domain-containing protein [Tepidisphaeraceae bacterium]
MAEGMVALLKMPNRISAQKSNEERRIFPRKDMAVPAPSRRVDNTLQARQNPALTLYLRDLSLGGLSAISPLPLEQGERLNVFFPRQGNLGGWDALGRVLRCEPSTMGYRVAMEFDPLPAA